MHKKPGFQKKNRNCSKLKSRKINKQVREGGDGGWHEDRELKIFWNINKWVEAIIRNPRASYCPEKTENYQPWAGRIEKSESREYRKIAKV